LYGEKLHSYGVTVKTGGVSPSSPPYSAASRYTPQAYTSGLHTSNNSPVPYFQLTDISVSLLTAYHLSAAVISQGG